MKWFTSNSVSDSGMSCRLSIALLVVRVVMGAAFILHGLPKIQNPMSWMGPDSPIPGVFMALAAVAEFFGGITLILGLLTSLTSIGLLITMIGAAGFHISNGDAFVGYGPSWELAAVYATLSLLFLLVGPGKYSVDNKLFK